MPDADLPETDDRDLLAGEYALDVLEGEELALARRLFLADRDFAEQVRWWRLRLARMAEAAGEVLPSADVWPAIARRMAEAGDGSGGAPAVTALEHRKKGMSGRGIALAMAGSAAAAAMLTFVIVKPAVTPPVAPVETAAPASGERLIAQLQSEDGALQLAGFVDPQAGEIALSLSGFVPAEGQATELWVVPEGGAPQSLGLVPASGSFSRALTEEERAALIAGAALAVTYENADNAPHAAPTSDILVIGGLTEV